MNSKQQDEKKEENKEPELLNKQLEEEQSKTEDWKNKYLRALADYQNLIKRTAEEAQETHRYAGRYIIEAMLPVIDNFESAQKHLQDHGLELALNECFKTLTNLGVTKIEAAGKPFDPAIMECIEKAGEEDKVTEVVRDGYLMHGKVIRVARVKVGNKKEEKYV